MQKGRKVVQASTRAKNIKRIASIGLLALTLALSIFTAFGGNQHANSGKSALGLEPPAAFAGGGPPPDLTGSGGNGGDPTPTPTPTP
jgi:hypothetical protein